MMEFSSIYMNKEIFRLIKNYQHINIMCFFNTSKKKYYNKLIN